MIDVGRVFTYASASFPLPPNNYGSRGGNQHSARDKTRGEEVGFTLLSRGFLVLQADHCNDFFLGASVLSEPQTLLPSARSCINREKWECLESEISPLCPRKLVYLPRIDRSAGNP